MLCDQALDKLLEKVNSRRLVQEEHGFQEGAHYVALATGAQKKPGLDRVKPTITDNLNSFPGFQIPFCRDRKKHGRGVCLHIADEISGTRCTDLKHPNIELLWVEIYATRIPSDPLLVGCYGVHGKW